MDPDKENKNSNRQENNLYEKQDTDLIIQFVLKTGIVYTAIPSSS